MPLPRCGSGTTQRSTADARLEGRVTLNPSAHIDWVGRAPLRAAGMGLMQGPCTFSPETSRGRKWGEALVALAGPLSNFLLAAACYALWDALPAGSWSGFFYYGATVNLTLCFLNLLPVPPLDGFSIVRVLIPLRSYRAVAWLQRYGIVILVVLSLVGVLGRVLGRGAGRVHAALCAHILTGGRGNGLCRAAQGL